MYLYVCIYMYIRFVYIFYQSYLAVVPAPLFLGGCVLGGGG